jgi:hypothetical protein
MRRIVLSALFLLLLIGCGGPPPDTTIPDPPKSTPIEKSDNPKINKLLDDWRREVPAAMKAAGAKDPIEQKVFQSTASLQEIYDFYDTQLTQKNWHQSKSMPGIQNGILLTGYELGTTSLVVGVVDATQLGSPGVIIYLAKGTT